MKKFAAIALALILAMSSMFATVGVAGSSGEAAYDSNELSIGFEIKDNGKGVVVDVENMKIYGLEPLLTVEALETNYLSAGTGFTMKVVDVAGNPVKYVGTGTQIVLNDGVEDYIFDVVIFGDLTGDSVIDVIDAAQAQRISAGKVEATELAVYAGDADKDGEITVDDYATQVNAAISEEPFNQNATGTEKTGIVEVDEQVFVSENKEDYALSDKDVTLTYNDIEVDSRYFDISDVKYDKVEETGEIYGEVTITGKGLFRGEITLKIEVVSLLEKAVATVNEVIEDANLADVVTAKYNVVNGVADIKVEVNASKIIRGNFDVNMAGLNGLLTKIDEFKAENLQEATLTVGDLAIATNGDFDRAAIKALVFDIAKGLFCDIANADDNVVKSYSGVLVTNNKLADLAEEFNIDVVMTADADIDIDRVKAFASKISRYVAFDVVDGNAVIDITMPAGFATKVVDVLGQGDVEAAKAKFDNFTIDLGLDIISVLEPSDISATNAKEIAHLISVIGKLDAVVDKVLGEVTEATVTDANGNVHELLNGGTFYIEKSENEVEAIVEAIRRVVDGDLLGVTAGAFANGDIYTAEFDVAVDYRNISEKIIVNVDFFGAVETPTIIEETATYFSDIITKLGLANVAKVSYDAENCRALATLNAREFATNLSFDEKALDGLYTDIKGYFDDNYGTSTIVVGDKEIVKAGKINKTALKDLIFSAARGFFEDAANIGADNVLRSFNTVVTEADGTEHKFDLDFALEGSEEDIARIEKIAAKVANYVSFEVVNGNAVVSAGVPANIRNSIVNVLGKGDAAEAVKVFNNLTVETALTMLSLVDAENISASSAKEVQAIVNLVCGFDTLIDKALNKVTYAQTTVNGVVYDLLADDVKFDLEGASSIEALVNEAIDALNPAVKGLKVSDFVNEDGTYTLTVDGALAIGGIKETVVLNLDVFGDIEKENAIEDTVDYVGGILADLGLSNMASVTYADGKAVAAFNASEFIANGFNFDENSFDGLYTEIRGYFDDNFSDSTIKVGDFDLVVDGKINKVAVKDFIFDFATGFFTDVANMDSATIRSYNTVVVDADGNEEVFAFDFNLDGTENHIEKIKELSAKVAEHVSFAEVNGNAVVDVKLPATIGKTLVSAYNGNVEAARADFNDLTVEGAFGLLKEMDADHISPAYANDIERIIGVICDVSVLANKVLAKVDHASIDVNGVNYDLLTEGAKFNLPSEDIKGLVTAVESMLNTDLLTKVNVGDFMNADGTYTLVVNAGTTIGGINETITINVAIF